MHLSKATIDLLASLDAFSDSRLRRKNDLGILLELSAPNKQRAILDALSFQSKFISKTFAIMTRIGKEGSGYEKLELAFTDSIGKARLLIQELLDFAPDSTRQHFSSAYLAMTGDSLESLLALCYDLNWYKNWLLDNTDRHRQAPAK